MLHSFKFGAARGLFSIILLSVLFCTSSCVAQEQQSESAVGQVMPYEEYRLVMDGLNQKINSITERDPKKASEEILAYLESNPAFEDAGMSEDGSSIWGRLKDGTVVSIPNHQLRHESVHEPEFGDLESPGIFHSKGVSASSVWSVMRDGSMIIIPTNDVGTGEDNDDLESLKVRSAAMQEEYSERLSDEALEILDDSVPLKPTPNSETYFDDGQSFKDFEYNNKLAPVDLKK